MKARGLTGTYDLVIVFEIDLMIILRQSAALQVDEVELSARATKTWWWQKFRSL